MHDPGGLKQNSGNFSKNIHFHFQKAGKDTFLKINVGCLGFFFFSLWELGILECVSNKD